MTYRAGFDWESYEPGTPIPTSLKERLLERAELLVTIGWRDGADLWLKILSMPVLERDA